jgi:hypothetical protein
VLKIKGTVRLQKERGDEEEERVKRGEICRQAAG